MGSSKSGGKVEIAEYSMSMHVGICSYGEGIQLLNLKYGEKEIWNGELSDAETLAINHPDLFGGSKKEGGVKGLAWWLPGKPDQIMPESLAQRLGLTSSTCPGFRGLASVFFTGTRNVVETSLKGIIGRLLNQPSNNQRGMYLAANNPYLRSISARTRRPSVGLDPAIALIRMPDSSTGRKQWASNPAHMIYECYTNTSWGMGENPNLIDKESFEEAAILFHNEGLGLNMKWSRQTEIGKFIGEILNHVYAATFVNPLTGKHTIKTLRADYDVLSLPVVNQSNARLTNFKRKAWGEITNEVVVTMTNMETGKEETVTVQDLAGIASQGGVTSTSKNYYGVGSRELALKLAERDLAMMVNPIATCEVEVSQEFWKTVVNGVLVLSWPEYDIDRLVFRVSEINRTRNSLKLSLYEDIFGLDYASYNDAGGTEWQNPSERPDPVSYYQIGTAPAFMTAAVLGKSDPSELVYPEAITNVVVAADSDDDVSYDVVTYVADVNGTITRQNIGTRAYRSTFVLLAPIPAAAQTTLTTLPGRRGAQPEVGEFVMFGTGLDEHTEICTVQAITDEGYLLNRGVLDTVPKNWPVGTRAFVIPAANVAADPTNRSTFEDVSYWLLSRTTLGVLPLENAPRFNATLSMRPYLPNRPANVKINGIGFGTVSALGLSSIPVTWSNRNRTLESQQVFKWEDADVAGEQGQVTEIVVRTPTGTLIKTYPGLTGTSFNIPVSDIQPYERVVVAVYARIQGNRSLQGYALTVNLSATPYLLLQGDVAGRLKLSGRDGFLKTQGD